MAEVNLETASQLFSTEVTERYQNKEYLAGTIEERHGVRGTAVNIPVSDILEMQQKSFAPADIEITPYAPTNVVISTYDWALKTVIGGGEKTLFAYDEILAHAKTHAAAVARALDYIKINALFASPLLAQIPVVPDTVGATTGMNQAKLSAGLSLLEASGVDVNNGEVSLWLPSAIKPELMADERVVNMFYNSTRPLADNRFNNYLGIDIRTLGANGINQIPFTTNAGTDTYLVPLVSRDSMIQTFNRDPQTRMVFLENQDRYELLSVFTSGAGVVQPEGIALITADTPDAANP